MKLDVDGALWVAEVSLVVDVDKRDAVVDIMEAKGFLLLTEDAMRGLVGVTKLYFGALWERGERG